MLVNSIRFCLLCFVFAASSLSSAAQDQTGVPRYDHILVIIAENRSYGDIIGKVYAPHLNHLAETYGTATRFYAEVHPSEPNYVAMIGGDTFGIRDDDAYYCKSNGETRGEPRQMQRYCSSIDYKSPYASHTIDRPSLVQQLEEHGYSWRGYFEDIPKSGSRAVYYPDPEHAVPGKPMMLYASKHNGFINFKWVQDHKALEDKFIGFDRLYDDLKSGQVPNYAHIVPNQCNDMHGLHARDIPNVPSYCDGSKPNAEALVEYGDQMIGDLVNKIMNSPIWKNSKTAIVITWDEGNYGGDDGCCGSALGSSPGNPYFRGGGHIATIVITNQCKAEDKTKCHTEDKTPYNHYSLLATTQLAFGIDAFGKECLGQVCNFPVAPMIPLFAVKEEASAPVK